MGPILCIETSSSVCSVALAGEKGLLAEKKMPGSNMHSAGLSPLVADLLSENGIKPSDLIAVCVSKGPGSFTGLRIGVAFSKGMCYSLGLPLISISTLRLLALPHFNAGYNLVMPVINAGNGEIYFSRFNGAGEELTGPEAAWPGQEIFEHFNLRSESFLLAGQGAALLEPFIPSDSKVDLQKNTFPSAGYMAVPSYNKWKAGEFENLHIFEPYYLKDFIARKSSDKIRRVLNN